MLADSGMRCPTTTDLQHLKFYPLNTRSANLSQGNHAEI